MSSQLRKRRQKIKPRPRKVDTQKPLQNPRKRRQRQKNDQTKFLETIGSHGGDARFPEDETVVPESATYKDETITIIVNPPLTQRSYWMPLLAIFSQAFTKGFIASSQSDSAAFTPYYAFVYLVKTLEGAINDAAPLITTAPLWFVILYQALRPKKAKFRTGIVGYKFETDPSGVFGFGVDPPSTIDWAMAGTKYVFGSPDGSGGEIDGYIVLSLPPPYTNELGELSYQKMIQYFAPSQLINGKMSSGLNSMWEIVDLNINLGLQFDASAYAAVTFEQGGAVGTTGGYVSELFSEVFIKTPLLSIFSTYEQDLYRVNSECRIFGGGGCYVGGKLNGLARTAEMRGKIRPIFKKMDFNEVFEVCALWLANVLTLASGNILQEDGTTPLICPLTVQDFRILLRQAILSMNMEAQSMTQDLTFFSLDEFFPFIVSSGTCAKQLGNTMVLPIPLVENLRAAIRRTFRAKSADGKWDGQIVDFTPVWGMWASDIPLITNYTYTNGAGTFPVFTTLVAEMPINLIDGSFTPPGGPTVWLDLNGPELLTNATLWNEFVSNLAANSTTLTPIGSEKGISALEVITLSFVQLNIPQVPPPLPAPVPNSPLSKTPTIIRKLSAEKPLKLGKPRTTLLSRFGVGPQAGTNASPYNNWSTNFVCSNQRIVSSAWSECQQYWILPATRTDGAPVDNSNYSAYQSEVCEPNFFYLGSFGNSTTTSNPDIFSTTFQRHLQYASMMSKPVAGTPNTWEDYLSGAAANGRGSFLGRLAGGVVGALVGQPEIGAEIGGEIF